MNETDPNPREWRGSGGITGAPWTLTEETRRYVLQSEGKEIKLRGEEAALLNVRRRWGVFYYLTYFDGESLHRYRGLPRKQALALESALARFKDQLTIAREREAEAAERSQLLAVYREFIHSHSRVVTLWQDLIAHAIEHAISTGKWVSAETVDQLVDIRPSLDVDSWHNSGLLDRLAYLLSDEERQAIDFMRTDIHALVNDTNEQILRNEEREHAEFFETLEKNPLTPEQRRAVICYDNRVKVTASAGSGKTSVMVARAAYAIYRGFVKPERVLMLAFNKSAAEELGSRVAERLARWDIDASGINASTFHAFGLSVIGEATGRKPNVADWASSSEKAVQKLNSIVSSLCEESDEFEAQWNTFRFLYASQGPGPGGDEPRGFQTFKGDEVRSRGEQLIANWLFLSGIDYEYEKPYSVDLATPTHAQYRPDFYYPEIDAWHEHWALESDGRAPAEFDGYEDGMRWKKAIHREHGTTLIETTKHEIVDGEGFDALRGRLAAHGLFPKIEPFEFVERETSVSQGLLLGLFHTFMQHAKSNTLTVDDLNKRASADIETQGARSRLFLSLYDSIQRRWDRLLTEEDSVDFEDMIVQAADFAEDGDYVSDFDLVLVDEFQDASHARARLTAALVDSPAKYLLTVGDDWQAINRFAGADLSVMHEFEEWFGKTQHLKLETTFRCTQEICDVSSAFVTKNPSQESKTVKAFKPEHGDPVLVLRASGKRKTQNIIRAWIDDLANQIQEGDIKLNDSKPITIRVLGRYKKEKIHLPVGNWPGIDLAFMTMHRSKGLEADYVVVLNMRSGVSGFPCEIVDDPILDLAMTEGEPFPHAEERRLFYVALTRAKRQVALVDLQVHRSVFLQELLDQKLVSVQYVDAAEDAIECERCGEGVMVPRRKHSEFYGCSTFPTCRKTLSVGEYEALMRQRAATSTKRLGSSFPRPFRDAICDWHNSKFF